MENGMAKLIAFALISLLAAGAEPLLAKDYVLKLELRTEIETKVGDEMSKKESGLRTLEFLVAPGRRFQGKTIWDNKFLSARGKLTETEDGALVIEIDCKHLFSETGDRTRVKTTVVLPKGETVFIGGSEASQTSEAPNEIRDEKRKSEFRLTLIEDDSDDDSED
jgi:hypothetical protein